MYSKCSEQRCTEIIETNLDDNKRDVRLPTATIFNLQQIFDKSCVYAKDSYAYFVGLGCYCFQVSLFLLRALW